MGSHLCAMPGSLFCLLASSYTAAGPPGRLSHARSARSAAADATVTVAEGEILLAACDFPGWVISRVDDASWGNPASGCNSTTTFLCVRAGDGEAGGKLLLLLADAAITAAVPLMLRCACRAAWRAISCFSRAARLLAALFLWVWQEQHMTCCPGPHAKCCRIANAACVRESACMLPAVSQVRASLDGRLLTAGARKWGRPAELPDISSVAMFPVHAPGV